MNAPSKQCFKCGAWKPHSEFYKHKAMKDGLLGKCKICTKKDASMHRLENLEKIREYDKSRSKLPHRVQKRIEVYKEYKLKFPERVRANIAVNNALRDKKIVKWPACAVPDCNSKNPVAHHPDYSRPLDVVWLCQAHHRQAHALLKDCND